MASQCKAARPLDPAWGVWEDAPIITAPGPNNTTVQGRVDGSIGFESAYRNEVYQVFVRRIYTGAPLGTPFAKVTHLSVKRHDRAPIHDWRDLQRIKNDICGPEREAIELYPAESRKLDTSNQFHLWVLDAGERVPVGSDLRQVVSPEQLARDPDPTVRNARQRPFDPLDPYNQTTAPTSGGDNA